jgi:hypothetical protein
VDSEIAQPCPLSGKPDIEPDIAERPGLTRSRRKPG